MKNVFAHEWLMSTLTIRFSFCFVVSHIFEDNIKTAARRCKLKPRRVFKDGIQINPEVYGKHVSIFKRHQYFKFLWYLINLLLRSQLIRIIQIIMEENFLVKGNSSLKSGNKMYSCKRYSLYKNVWLPQCKDAYHKLQKVVTLFTFEISSPQASLLSRSKKCYIELVQMSSFMN